MLTRLGFRMPAYCACLLGVGVLLIVAATAAAAEQTQPAVAKEKKVTSKLQVDPKAERIDMFDGMKNGQIDVSMVPKNAFGGTAFFENNTDKPLTVKLPNSFVAVQVLKQLGLGSNAGTSSTTTGGRAQPAGGGMGMGGMGMGMGGIGGYGGGGFFSVPPETIVRVPYETVCLAHGKPDPNSKMRYKPIPVDEFSKDPVLAEILTMVPTGKVDRQVLQAAAWHLTDKMSWEQLADKRLGRLGGNAQTPYFAPEQIVQAQNLFTHAATLARAKAEKAKELAEKGEATPVSQSTSTEETQPISPRVRNGRR